MARNKAPLVSEFMSVLPHDLDSHDNVQQARILLAESKIRHIPVMHGSSLFGIVSATDVASSHISANTLLSEICSQEVYTAAPNETVAAVAAQLIARRISAAVVVDIDAVVGVFTTTDALRALVAAYA